MCAFSGKMNIGRRYSALRGERSFARHVEGREVGETWKREREREKKTKDKETKKGPKKGAEGIYLSLCLR